ncbi:response regulator [Mangrovicoccus sp. HB161399]|uniref:response regulator n=1 Tax=Mangrovicoccus sp. HB161399 TaxID=2720392 RepID=UPI0020A63EAC|nr:response regulator [Mangrovicoccus sp. HB161399]
MSPDHVFEKRPKAMADAEILLVEDDDFEAKTVIRAFSEARIANRITRVEDGVEALETLLGDWAANLGEHKLILLIDLNMPRMNGIELLREIRSDPKLRRLVCFVLTTSSSEQDIADAYDLNVAGYVVKSQAGEDFRQLVQLIDDYWTTVRMPE